MASMNTRSTDQWDEPTLDELMADPMIQLMMQRDRVNPTDMLGEIHRVRTSFGAVAA